MPALPSACPFEPEILAAVLEDRFPAGLDPDHRAHAASCPHCQEVVVLAEALAGDRRHLMAAAPIPEPGQVWWRSQLRARREAQAAANLPITAAQIIGFGGVVALLGACFGATSTWFQALLKSTVASLSTLTFSKFLAAATAPQLVLLGAVAALLLLVPTALYFAFARD